ncbi:uncharacterized protein LOC122854861 [Aphidius gifuensis]|uniref:uncharacterized protein LOC122854861 n=1 Tax=Aphidius gifuensis TaxID=684658 RepID=UPI001CDD47DC|nr:uncharacterized protein LOC122854861 [Aphidius gifuensis]
MDQKNCNVKYPHIDQQIKTLIDVSERVSDTDIFIEIAIDRFNTKIERSASPEFIRRSLVLFNREESFEARKKYWSFVAQMIISRRITLSLFQSEYCQMLEETTGKDIEFNVLWIYKAEILKTLIIRGAYPLKNLIRTTSGLKKRGLVGKLVGNLLKILVESEGKTLIAEKWNESGIEWKDLFDKSLEDPDDIMYANDLQFLTIGETDQLSKRLLKLLRESSPHDKAWKNWVTKNVVEEKIKEPKFVRILFTAILESGIDSKESSKYFFGEMNFYQPTCSQFLLPIIKDYIGSNFESELQCLYALTDVNYKYGNPPGFVYDIIKELHEKDIISVGAILAWHAGTNHKPAELLGHREAVMNLLSKPFSFKFENNDDKQQSTSSKEKKK